LSKHKPPFEILEVLGEGAFGTVCVAKDTRDPLNRRVAIKVLKSEFAQNAKIVQRSRDEARLLARLNHPNIVRVERLVELDGLPILVMEWVRGLSLSQLLRHHRNGLPTSVVLKLTGVTCDALHACWTATGEDGSQIRVIHRDIKPSNILFSTRGEIRVVDFGIARGEFDDREAKTESVVMGSRAYMAPERLDGIEDTPAVDVYSLGMTMFELLTGFPMNLSVNPSSHKRGLEKQLGAAEFRGLPHDAQETLRTLIGRMCAYDPEDRPAAKDVQNQMQDLQAHVLPDDAISPADFGVRVVKPLYDARPRTEVAEAMSRLEDGHVLRTAFGIETGPNARKKAFRPSASLYISGLVLLIGTLSLAAALKATVFNTEAGVRVWIPSDVEGMLGTQKITSPGDYVVEVGPTVLDLELASGAKLRCRFHADDGVAVRYVVDQGRGAITVDDGAAVPCDPR